MQHSLAALLTGFATGGQTCAHQQNWQLLQHLSSVQQGAQSAWHCQPAERHKKCTLLTAGLVTVAVCLVNPCRPGPPSWHTISLMPSCLDSLAASATAMRPMISPQLTNGSVPWAMHRAAQLRPGSVSY